MSANLLVTGAAGHLGQRVIAHLLDTHHIAPQRIVAGTRDPAKLAALQARGVQVRKLDFEYPATFAAAFSGVERLLLISTDAVDRPGRRLAQHQAAIAAAATAGVKHIVYTSMPLAEESLVLFAPDHAGTEKTLLASGLGWTILRNNWYMENLFMALPQALSTGKWNTATGDGKAAYVSREDCARTAAAALAATNTGNARYDVTGAAAFSADEIAALVRDVVGKPLAVVHLSDAELKQGLLAAGVPEFVAPLVISIDANTRAGKLNVVSDAVHKLTGKAPQALRSFLEEHTAQLGG